MDMNTSSLFTGSVDGRRIFDVNYLIHQVKKASKHGNNNCGWMEVDLVREVKNGLRSSFEFKCRECHLVFDLKTDDSLQKDFNLDMISAATDSNVGLSSLDAILKAGGIPFVPNSAYETIKSNVTGSDPACVGGCSVMKGSHLQAHNYPHAGDHNSVLTYDSSSEEHVSDEPTELMDITSSKNEEFKKDGNETHSCKCNANNKRVKNRNTYSVRCLFCGKVILHRSLLIHFVRKHKDKEEVKKILNLQKNNPRRTILLRNLKRKCIETFNGPPWKKQDPNYVPCVNCKNLYRYDNLHKHYVTCSSLKEKTVGKMSNLLKMSHDRESEQILNFKIKILLGIRTEIVRDFINGDPILTEYGIHSMIQEQKKGNSDKFSSIRSSLYMVVAVFFIMQQKHPTLTIILDIFDPKLWGAFIEAIHEYTKIQTTLRKLRQQFYNISRFAAVQCRRLEVNADLLNKWTPLFKNNHIQVIRHSQRWKNLSWFTVTKKLATLFKFAHDELRCSLDLLKTKGFDPEAFETLNYAAMLKIMSYNRNRVVDLEKILISDFGKRQTVTRDTDVWKGLDESEKFTAERCNYFEIRSKVGRSIPILLDGTVVEAIEIIIFLREKSGVSRENPFVFGERESSFFKINSAINKLATKCGVENSCTASVITSADLKKYVACMSHALSMNNSDVDILRNALGSNGNIAACNANTADYASTSDDVMLRLAKLFRLLVALNEESIDDFKGMNIDDIDVNVDIGSSETLSKPYVNEPIPAASSSISFHTAPVVKEAPRETVARTSHDSAPEVLRSPTSQTISSYPAASVSQNTPFRSNLLPSASEHGHPCIPAVDEVYNQSSDFVSVPYPFSTHRTISSNSSLHTFDSALNYNPQKQHYSSNCRENPNQMHHPALISTMPYAAAVNDPPYYSPAQCESEAQRSCMDFFGFQSGMQNRWPVQSFSSDLSMPSKAHASSHKRKMALDDIATTHHFSLSKPTIEPRKPSRSKSPSALKIKRITWTPEEKQALLEFFGPDIFIDQKLPSYYTCQKAIEKYDCLHLRTKAQVKAFINNEQRKWKKRLGQSLQEQPSSTAINLQLHA